MGVYENGGSKMDQETGYEGDEAALVDSMAAQGASLLRSVETYMKGEQRPSGFLGLFSVPGL